MGEGEKNMNPAEGRVPLSWNECADWLEAGGVVWNAALQSIAVYSAETFRLGPITGALLSFFRLLPPPGLVAAPEGMDGGGWLGQGKDVPDGWEWRPYAGGAWTTRRVPDLPIVQCRPPVPKREPEWVPLTKLVGRTVWGETEPMTIEPLYSYGLATWTWFRSIEPTVWVSFPDGTLDLDTGRVKVEPEGEQ